MEVFECDVARRIALVLFPFADKRYTLCNVANNRRLDFDGLVVNQYQHQCMQNTVINTISASTRAVSHRCKRARKRARLASA